MSSNSNNTAHSPTGPASGAEEIRAAALQYVRQVCGVPTPSKEQEEAFNLAVDQIAEVTRVLLESMQPKPVPQTTPQWEEDDLGFFYGGTW